MHVTILVPDIHELPTGGNIYNRRIVEEVRRDLPVEMVSWSPSSTSHPPLDLPTEAVLVVDSLLVRHQESLRVLREAHPSALRILMGHYLHCIDPGEQETEAARTERGILNVFDGVVTTSHFAKQALVHEGVSENRIGVVPPGLDESYRAPAPPPSGRSIPRLLTVANLLPGKGVRSFIEVLRSLSEEAWTWTLVGEASLDSSYAQAVSQHLQSGRLARRVTHTGSVSTNTLRTWYDRADVFVLPSRFETCSMAMREAMARGLPVVGYRVGGMPENLGDARAGHLVPAGQPSALRTALRTLLTDPMARAQKGRAARRRSQSFPTWQEAGARFQRVLEELLAAGHSSEEDRAPGTEG